MGTEFREREAIWERRFPDCGRADGAVPSGTPHVSADAQAEGEWRSNDPVWNQTEVMSELSGEAAVFVAPLERDRRSASNGDSASDQYSEKRGR